ncbi:hypothetical protein L596_009764 [Steinernema carpocapsae]|uniref:Uncharacterized protein n=1 Tax=Steinernema carpocapsae TaxID=34508 RepID=A0A4U5PGT9_STECR|nr:hypothetical protein L596_009764 [Steinernema carpocapsae]
MCELIDFFDSPPVHCIKAQWAMTFLSLLIDVVTIVFLISKFSTEFFIMSGLAGAFSVIGHLFLVFTVARQLRRAYLFMAVYLFFEISMFLAAVGVVVYGVVDVNYVSVIVGIALLLYRALIIRFFKCYYHFVRMRAPDVVQTNYMNDDSRVEDAEMDIDC